MKQFTSREHTPVVQFVKYGIGGAIATGVHITFFFLSAWLIFPALGANDPAVKLLAQVGLHIPPALEAMRARNAALDTAIAFLFSNLTAYLVNITWVFESGRHRRALEFLMFTAVSGLSMVLGTSLQTYLIGHWGISTSIAFGANVVCAILINYAMRKFVIFKK